METLLEDYKCKLKTAESMIESGMTFGDEQANRVKIKQSLYRSMIVDIERAVARVSNENSGLNIPVVMPCLYKQSFIDRFNKYFEYKPKIYEYVGKNSKREYTLDDLHKEYEKAMGETPFK